jgi:hypothetical protein
MQYLNEKLLTEDLIADLGFRSDKSKLYNFGSGIWNTLKALARPQDLFKLNDEGAYEEFLSRGFADVIKQRGSNTVKVTYAGKLYSITSVSSSTLTITGISKAVAKKVYKLKLAKIKVGKASRGATGFETSGNYAFLRKLIGGEAIFKFADKVVNCTIKQATAGDVTLVDKDRTNEKQEYTATIPLDTILVYPDKENRPTITYAKISFAIDDMVTTKDEEGKKGSPDYTVDKTLFSINFDKEDRDPFNNSKERYNQYSDDLKNYINKGCSLHYVRVADDEALDIALGVKQVNPSNVIEKIENLVITSVDDNNVYVKDKNAVEGKKPVAIKFGSILGNDTTNKDLIIIYLPAEKIKATKASGLKGEGDGEDTDSIGQFSDLTPEDKQSYITSLQRFMNDKVKLNLIMDGKTSSGTLTSVDKGKLTATFRDATTNTDINFNLNQIEKSEKTDGVSTIFVNSKKEGGETSQPEEENKQEAPNAGSPPPPPPPPSGNAEEKKEATYTAEEILSLFS